MKNVLLKSLVCVGIVLCMVGCSAGDTAKESNTNATELTENMEENSTNTAEIDSQTEVENEVKTSLTEDATEQMAGQEDEISDVTIGEDTMAENTNEEDIEAEPLHDEPEVEMVDFETWAKQEGNEEICLVVWNETTKTQRVIENEEVYNIQVGDRFAIPYLKTLSVQIGGEEIYWENTSYMELDLSEKEEFQVVIFDTANASAKFYMLINK